MKTTWDKSFETGLFCPAHFLFYLTYDHRVERFLIVTFVLMLVDMKRDHAP